MRSVDFSKDPKQAIPLRQEITPNPIGWRTRAAALKSFDSPQSLQALVALEPIVPLVDKPDYYVFVGLVHHGPKQPSQNLATGHAFFERAAAAGSGEGAFYLGHGYLAGTYGQVDTLKALSWLLKARQLGYEDAAGLIFLTLRKDPKLQENQDLVKTANQILHEDAARGSPSAMLELARQYGRTNPDAALPYYEKLALGNAQGSLDTPQQVAGALCLGLRYMLGFGAMENWDKANHHLSRAVAAGAKHSHIAEHLHYAACFISALKKLEPPWGHPRSLHFGDWVRNISLGTLSFDAAYDAIGKNIAACDELVERLFAATVLSWSEETGQHENWLRLVKAAELHLLFQSSKNPQNDAIESTFDYGPMFNKPTMLGRPQLGILRHGGLESGVGELEGLEAGPDGEIRFYFRAPRNDIGPLLSSEDVNVAIALTFGQATPIVPHVSVEDLISPLSGRYRMLKRKVWKPDWIGHTLLGKTLYATDVLAAKLMEQPHSFVESGETGPSVPRSPKAQGIIDMFAKCGGEIAGQGGRVVVHPMNFYRTWTRSSNGGHVCRIHKLTMGVLGANMVNTGDGALDMSANKNDDRFRKGRAANHFTREYDTIAHLLPVFDRLRQLTALLEALKELHDKGFKPSPQLLQRAVGAATHLMQRPALSPAKRLVL
jgi:TPR repeat protein